jgi:hypothetical protein
MKVIEEKAFQHRFYFLISIQMNIFYKYGKIRDIDFHLMLLEHDQFRMHIHVNMGELVDRVVEENELP